jgi:hypothetical protein
MRAPRRSTECAFLSHLSIKVYPKDLDSLTKRPNDQEIFPQPPASNRREPPTVERHRYQGMQLPPQPNMSQTLQESSLFEIDRELDLLLDEIQEALPNDSDDVPVELMAKFHAFCEAYSQKVDRIGFLNLMESRAAYCRAQAARLSERARTAENKVERTKNMVLYYLRSRELRKIEGCEFTLREQKNSQDSIIITDEQEVPLRLREIEAKIPGHLWQELLSKLPEGDAYELKACVRQMKPSNEAIKNAAVMQESVPGAEIRRGFHLRVA